MAGLLCNKFKGGKDNVMLVLAIREMLLVPREIMQEGRQGWLSVIIVKTEDLDAYDSDYDDGSNAKAVLMANLSNYGSYVISKEAVQDTNLYAQQDLMILSVIEQIYKEQVKTFEQCPNIDLSTREKMIDSQIDDMIKEKLALKQQINSLEQNLSNQIKEKESLLQTFTVFKNESKEKESKYMDKEIDLEKKIKELDNIVYKVGQSAQTVHMLTKPQVFYDDTHKQALGYQNPFYLKKAQRIKPTLYDGSVISSQHAASLVIDDEETLILEEDTSSDNQNALEILEYFENNDLKAQLQAKGTTISSCGQITLNKRLHKEIEHLKKIYKDQFDLIKKIRALSKEQCDSLIAQLNSKSMKNADLKGQIQEKVFVTTTLQNELRKLKGKDVLDNAATITNATTIASGMFKLDLDPLAPSEKLVAITPMNKVKKVRFSEPLTSSSNIHKHVKSSKTPDSNTPVLPSTGLKSSTSASRSQPKGNKKNDRISQTPSSNIKNKVEDHPRRVKSKSNKKNRVKDPIYDANVKYTMSNANSELICVKCKQCMFDGNHDVCFLDFVNDVNVRSKSKSAKKSQQHNIWKPTGKVFTEVVYKWKPTGRLFTLVGWSKKAKIVESKIANNSEPNNSLGSNAIDVPFSSSLVNDRDTNLYIISLDDMLNTSPIYLLSKASKTKSWLWHRQLSHLNFDTLNKLAKDDLVRGIPKLKFKKDHLCSACALGKSKKSSHQPKAEDTNQEKLYLLHINLCGPMRMESINEKKYILVIVDDYSRFTWVKFPRSKDEAHDAIIKCVKNIQVRLNEIVRNVRHIMELNLSIRSFVNFMKMSASRIKHLLLALLNRMALSKDETRL
ncbi:retrovirus-related pol polyprotein from transposon TNT 1-94 [Tanacetum coccineum]